MSSVLIAPSTVNYPPAKRPVPATNSETETTVPCWKCGGTGFWCRGVLNGRPYSNTGFTCWTCEGTGYKVVPKSRVILRKPAVQPTTTTKEVKEESAKEVKGMWQCKSGKHHWLHKEDAEKCCNGWHQELIVAQPTLGETLPPDARHTRVECTANIGFVWVEGPSAL